MIHPHSQIWTPETIGDIHSRALGRYRLSGFRPLRDLPTFDELVFLASGLTRFPLEGYKEKCKTETTIGARSASKPLVLETPIYIRSPDEIGRDAKIELARASRQARTALSVAGKLHSEEKKLAQGIIYELPARKETSNLVSAIKAGAIQLNVGNEIATDGLRSLIRGVRRRQETKVPILVGLAASRVEDEVRAAVKAGADGIVLEGLKTAMTGKPEGLFNYCRLPMIAAIPRAREALRESRALGEVSLIAGTGIRNGADASKAIALGADAVRIEESALVALGYFKSPDELTIDEASAHKVKPESGIHVAKFINSMTMEIALLARSLGKGDVHSLEQEDLSALTLEAALMTGVKLAGE